MVSCALTVNANSKQKWEKFLAKVLNEHKSESRAGAERSKYVPLAFVAGSGTKTKVKIELVNTILRDWQVDLVMKRKPKPGEEKTCPYYSPSTQNKMLWTFYAHMNKEHDWDYTENDFKGWKGCVDRVLAEQRFEKYVSGILLNEISILQNYTILTFSI